MNVALIVLKGVVLYAFAVYIIHKITEYLDKGE